MGQLRCVATGVLVLSLASCAAPSPRPGATGLTYSCCDEAEINRAYRPGEAVAIHWTVVGTSSGAPVRGVELNAELTGPFAGVDELKGSGGAGAGVSTLKADPVRPRGAALGEQLVSVITIPTTASPGYYNLTTFVVEPGSRISSGHIVQVVPAA